MNEGRVLLDYAVWLDRNLSRYGDCEQHCQGVMWGILHQWVGRPHVSHGYDAAVWCPICAVEVKHSKPQPVLRVGKRFWWSSDGVMHEGDPPAKPMGEHGYFTVTSVEVKDWVAVVRMEDRSHEQEATGSEEGVIRFVDLREADIGKRFAFWDTVRDRFLTLTEEQAWDDAQAFRRDWESVPLDAAELERYLRLMPEWARGEA